MLENVVKIAVSDVRSNMLKIYKYIAIFLTLTSLTAKKYLHEWSSKSQVSQKSLETNTTLPSIYAQPPGIGLLTMGDPEPDIKYKSDFGEV